MTRIFTRKVISLLIVVILVIFFARYLLVERVEVSLVERVFRDGLVPLQGGLTTVVRVTREVVGGLAGIGHAQEEKEALYQRIADLEGENNQLREYKLEAERLRQALEFKEANPQYELLIGRVIAHNPSNWYKTITVDLGSEDGVIKYMPVINPQGLVGKIISVNQHSSDILLITDPEGPAGAVVLVQDTRVPGVVEGMGDDGNGMLRMRLIPYDAVIKEGDEVVTSGLGSVFPAGIRIGKIQRVSREAESNSLQQYSLVAPEVDFNRLEEVMIITRFSGGG